MKLLQLVVLEVALQENGVVKPFVCCAGDLNTRKEVLSLFSVSKLNFMFLCLKFM